MKRTRSTNSRDLVLDAAEAVAHERGVPGLTLDAVAARAGVSKGGLLYHFPTKEALIQSMVARIAYLAKEHFKEELASEPPGPGRHAHCFLRLLLDSKSRFFPRLKHMATPLLVAVAESPELLDPMRRFFREIRQGMVEDGLAPERAWLIMAAVDGIKFWRILRIMEPSGRDLKKIRILLEKLINDEIPA
jgi:AcrR family transcriptional regulator